MRCLNSLVGQSSKININFIQVNKSNQFTRILILNKILLYFHFIKLYSNEPYRWGKVFSFLLFEQKKVIIKTSLWSDIIFSLLVFTNLVKVIHQYHLLNYIEGLNMMKKTLQLSLTKFNDHWMVTNTTKVVQFFKIFLLLFPK